MSVALIPESAPFSPEQRAWLNGFFAGVLGIANVDGLSTPQATSEPPAAELDFPWHDPSLPITDRLRLADGRPLQHRLMAAMAQLNCGACGYLCQTYSEAIANGEESDLGRCSPGGHDTAKTLRQIIAIEPPSKKSKAISNSLTNGSAVLEKVGHNRNHPVLCKLLESKRLTHRDSPKDTRHVAIDLLDTGLSYEPGDSLGVWPRNDQEFVARVLSRVQATGDELVNVDGTLMTFHAALSNQYTLTRVRSDFFSTMAMHAANSVEAAALVALADDSQQPFAGTADVLDVLERFASLQPPVEEFTSSLSRLQPRLYSISSSQRVHSNEVHLTVGVVRFESLGRQKHGVASNFLGVRSVPGEDVRIFIQSSKFRLPNDPATPIIMIGPGTGIAPFRAFLEERNASGAQGKNWLFFGNQFRSFDFLYQDELESWHRNGLLSRLDLAFSRDTSQKIYVQDRLMEFGSEIWHWISQGAHLYICGDAKHMAPDVETAIKRIAQEQGSLSDVEASHWISTLARERRLQKDVY